MAARLIAPALLLATALAPADAGAACVFDSFGDIVNPTDPSCRDNQLRYTRADNSGSNIALGYDVPVPVDSQTPVDGFRSYASLAALHQALDATHDFVAGQVVGQTVAGRDIWVYRIGDGNTTTVDGGTEPAILINGGIHAREWQSPEAVTALFEHMVEDAADGGIGQYLVENLNLLIVPVLNVDGLLTTQRYPDRVTADVEQPREGRMRRKNLRDPTTGQAIDEDIDQTADNFYGVDVNRNATAGWGQNGGSSARTTSLVYRGAQAGGEPESQALIAAGRLGPENRLRFYADVHSFSRVWIAPLTGNARRDGITASLTGRMQAVLNFKYGISANPNAIGVTSDYYARSLLIPSWTLELEPLMGGQEYGGTGVSHSGFILPDDQVARMRDEVVRMLLAGLYHQTDLPRVQAVRVTDNADDSVVYEASWTGAGARGLSVVADRALVPGGSYRLWLAFNKPMRWRDGAGQVADYPGQSVTLFPSLTLQFPGLGDSSVDLAIGGDASAWLDTPGGPGQGYLAYADDALAVDFIVPSSLQPTAASKAVLAADARDMVQLRLDADPSTRVDWSAGHWINYENENGAAGDVGGTDCTLVLFVAPAADAAPPADRAGGCRVAQAPPSPGPAPNPGGGGGGGGAGAGLLLALLAGLAARRRTGV